MMLALLGFVWEAQPPSPGPPDPSISQDLGSGGGGRKKYKKAAPDFWDVRERYLRRYAPKLQEAIKDVEVIGKSNETSKQDNDKLEGNRAGGGVSPMVHAMLLGQALQANLSRASVAQSAVELREHLQRASQLALDIEQIKMQYSNRAMALLLLDANW